MGSRTKFAILASLAFAIVAIGCLVSIYGQTSGDIYIVQRNGALYIEWYNGLTTRVLMVINSTSVSIPTTLVYKNQEVDQYFVNYSVLTSNYYTATKVDQLILGNVSALKGWALSTFYTKSQVDTALQNLRSYVDTNILGNKSEILQIVSSWIAGNTSGYITTTYVDRNILGNVSRLESFILGNKTEALSVASNWINGNFSILRNYVDTNVLGNYSALKSWVETNYYNKSVIDSWNLIKNYELQQNLNANGYAITGIGLLTMTGWAVYPTVDHVELFSLTGGASFFVTRNGTLIAPMVQANELRAVNTSYLIALRSGEPNELEFNGSPLIIHPAWGSSGYNPSGLVYISNDSSYVKVGIGTDNPQYRLDVNGDIRAKGGAVYADYFHFTENGNRTGIYFDYFPQSLPSPSGSSLENAIGLAVNGTPKTFIDVNGYVYAPRFYVTEENQYTSPKYYVDWYPDDTLRVVHYSGGQQPLIIHPFGVATGFSFDKNTLQRIQRLSIYSVSVLPNSWGTVVNVSFTGTVNVCLFSGNWYRIDQLEIDLDGVTKTFTISNSVNYGALCLTFVVQNSLVIRVHTIASLYTTYISVTLIEVGP